MFMNIILLFRARVVTYTLGHSTFFLNKDSYFYLVTTPLGVAIISNSHS